MTVHPIAGVTTAAAATSILPGSPLRYRTVGHGSRHLVFVHGLRNAGRTWAPFATLLDPTAVTAWLLDLPGCGDSPPPSDWRGATIERSAALVREFCAAAALTDVVLVGHSYGAAVGIALALEAPDLLAGLVLIGPASTEGLPFLDDDGFAALLDSTPARTTAFARLAFHRQPPDEAFDDLLTTVLAADPAHVEGAVRAMRAFTVADRLGAVRTPTLLIAGDRDRHVPIRFALRTAAAIRRCGVHVFHNIGHVPHWEEPATTAALLTGFVTGELRSGRQSPPSPP
jgi:sigma-B regulation protein RsbQ